MWHEEKSYISLLSQAHYQVNKQNFLKKSEVIQSEITLAAE